MSAYDFNLFTLGAGSGGVAGSRRAAAYGARVGICEDDRVGGTCVIRGCIPKKLLVYGAHFALEFADSEGYGWTVPERHFDWPTLVARKDREIDRLNGIYLGLLRDVGVTLYEGRGRLIDRHTVEITGTGGTRRVTAERILIATGGHPVLPSVPGIEHAWTSNDALSLPTLPRRVAIVGGGYIAVEFAGIFSALGVETTILIRGEHLLNGFDDDLRLGLEAAFARGDITVRPGIAVTRIDRVAEGLILTTDAGEAIAVDGVLYATGRAPNTRDLGLEAIGIDLGMHGAVPVDEFSQTRVPGIYAVGDVTDRLNLTPVAIAEARALAETLFNNNPTRFDPAGVPSAVFSIPPIATVGVSEGTARLTGRPVDIYRSSFRPLKHTLTGSEHRSMMKLVVDRSTDVVLGAHMLGTDAPEIVQGLAIAFKCGATKRQFDQTVGIHPTAAEEFVTMREKVRD